MTIQELGSLKIIVIIAKRVQKRLCHFEPAHVENKLEEREDWHVEINGVVLVALRGIQELTAEYGEGEVGVGGECYDLRARRVWLWLG